MQLPKSKFLTSLISGFAGGAVFPLLVAVFRREGTLRDSANNFIADMTSTYLVGSFSSRFPLVWFGSVVCGATYVFCVTNIRDSTQKWAKLSLVTILLLSLFTLWIEPFTSVRSAIVQTVIERLARLVSKLLDLGISFFWIFVCIRAITDINREHAGTIQQSEELSLPRSHSPLADPNSTADSGIVPSATEATLEISRKWQLKGAIARSSIIVDEVSQGSLWSGEHMVLRLPPGNHLVEARVWWVKTFVRVTLIPGQKHSLQVAWNYLGTKLVIREMSSA